MLSSVLVAAASFLVVVGQQLGLAGTPLTGVAALAPSLNSPEQPLPHSRFGVVAG